MTADEIVEKFKSYPGWDANRFVVYSPEKRKRKFEWEHEELLVFSVREQDDERSDQELLLEGVSSLFAGEFAFYYEDIGMARSIRKSAEARYAQTLGRHISDLKSGVSLVQDAVRKTGRNQMGPVDRLLKALEEAEPWVREILTEHIEKQEFQDLLEEGLITNPKPEKAAAKRLIVRLDYTLDYCTNLTPNNRVEHVINILTHFEIESPTYEATKKAVSKQRSANTWEEIHWELSNWASPGNSLGQYGKKPP